MLLPADSAFLFIEGYKKLLLRVLARAHIERTDSIIGDLAKARSHVKKNPEAIDWVIAELNEDGASVDPGVTSGVKGMKVDRWIYLRQTQRCAIFLDKEAKNAYEVKALTTPLEELVGRPPYLIETGLVEYQDHFVCDGLVANPVALGSLYKAQFSAAYSAIRKAGLVHVRPSV